MKRLSILLILYASTLSAFAIETQKTFSKVFTKGLTYTIDPVADSGTTVSQSNIPTQDGGNNVHCGRNAEYCISDASAFSISKVFHTVYQDYNTHGYYSYTFTPGKTGIYTFFQDVHGYDIKNEGSYEYEITYSITVVDVTSISMPSTLSKYAGTKYDFASATTVADSRATTNLSWHSSNTSVATIDNKGVMTANRIGNTTITCTASNGVSAKCEVTVIPVLVSSITLNQIEAELKTDESVLLQATIQPTNATTKAVTWSSSDLTIATVDDNGLVTAKSPGRCVITATSSDGSSKTAVCSLTVLSDVLYVDHAVGVPTGTLVLPIQLKNQSAITGCQFELQLPEGVSVAKDRAGNFNATMSDRSFDQDIMCSKLSNGNYQVIVFSPTSAALSGNEGAIAYVTLNVSETVAEGNYSLGIKSIELTKTSGEAVHHKDMTNTLVITSAVVGDTNGDGSVTVTDAVGIVNYILGRTPSVFITKAADVNGDGSITITDAVNVINIILNK